MTGRSRAAICILVLFCAAVALAAPATTQPEPMFSVDRFVFHGNTRFSSDQLNQVVDAALSKRRKAWPADRRLTPVDLEEARLAISQFYVAAGFINSGAVLEDEASVNGAIRMSIIEGRLPPAQIHVGFRGDDAVPTTQHLLSPDYIKSRIEVAARPPLNINSLKDELEILRQDPNVKTINAELKPVNLPGEASLDVQLQERDPWSVALVFSNRRPPSVGSTAVYVVASDLDLTGNGDSFSLRYDVLDGPLDNLQLDGAKDFNLDYTIPVTPIDTTVNLNFNRTDTVVNQGEYTPLDITSESDNFSLTVNQPVYRKPTADVVTPGKVTIPAVEVDVFGSMALNNNRSSLMGRPFSLSPGDLNGTEYVTELRAGQQITLRSDRAAFSGRSTFCFGVPGFNSTPKVGRHPSGDFVAWTGQLQYTHLLGDTRIQAVLRGSAQLADRPLLTVEQIALGGADTVRGYPENELVRDQAVLGSAQLRIPIIPGEATDILTLIPFFDAGYGWDRIPRIQRSQTIDSIGAGLQFAPHPRFDVSLFYGRALQNRPTSHQDVEDLGIHFVVTIKLI